MYFWCRNSCAQPWFLVKLEVWRRQGNTKQSANYIQSLKFNHLNSNFGTQVPSYIRNKKIVRLKIWKFCERMVGNKGHAARNCRQNSNDLSWSDLHRWWTVSILPLLRILTRFGLIFLFRVAGVATPLWRGEGGRERARDGRDKGGNHANLVSHALLTRANLLFGRRTLKEAQGKDPTHDFLPTPNGGSPRYMSPHFDYGQEWIESRFVLVSNHVCTMMPATFNIQHLNVLRISGPSLSLLAVDSWIAQGRAISQLIYSTTTREIPGKWT